jgi:putative ABC transport system substrate-binding protein
MPREGRSDWLPSTKDCEQRAGKGRNLRIDTRWTDGRDAELRKHAAELVALDPEVILAWATPTVFALQRVSRTVPIVFSGVIDPVGSGLVASLARPGDNATGFVSFEYALAAKWLELLGGGASDEASSGAQGPWASAGRGSHAALDDPLLA